MPTGTEKKTLKAEDLGRFNGTLHYWHTGMPWHPFVYTDGVRHVVTHGEAFWILDVIGSWQPSPVVKHDRKLQDMQFWTLTVNKDQSAVMRCERDRGNVAIEQEIPYTDFPLPEIKFYLAHMWCYWEYSPKRRPRLTQDRGALILPSEY